MYNHILQYLKNDIYPFHMPGHKRNMAFLPPNILELDLTEIPGMDVLSSPTGMIRDFEERITQFYGADSSFFLVNGSSAGILAAICATCDMGDPLVVPRNAHVSVYNAMVISGATPHYITPEITENGLSGGINPDAFDNMPYGAAALVVSPTYEGFVSDISAIANKVHSKGGLLIVDEAHGAHFKFSKSFPTSALECGADIVIQSLHKTLPALSQCALLHCKSKNLNPNLLKFLKNAIQTSSPSYILMAVCDYVLQLLWQQPQFFDDYINRLQKARKYIPNAKSTEALRLSGLEQIGKSAIFDIDISKLLLTAHTSLDAESISDMMAKEYKIQMEMAAAQHVLAMTSVADTEVGFSRLMTAVDGLNSKFSSLPLTFSPYKPALPQVKLTPREAAYRPSVEIPWENAIGRISAQLVAKYPPGIAILAPGEYISPDIPKQCETIRVIT